MNRSISYLAKHFSLFVIVFGAGCLFLSNIITKDIFTDEEYGQYSIIITYFSILYLFGILGSEQGFLRFSFKKKKGTIETYKPQFILVFFLALFSTTVGYISFKCLYSEIILNDVLLLLASFAIVLLLFLFNILRLNEDFVLSQIVANYWKAALFVLSVVFLMFNFNNFTNYVNLLLVNIIIAFLLAFFFVRSKIKISFNVQKLKLGATFFHFFLSIATFTLVTFSDRFLVENKFSIEEFGDYFYLSNLFLAPYSIIQNYIGFKQLVFFKNNFTVQNFKQQNRKSAIIGIFIGTGLILLVSLISSLGLFNFDLKKNICVIVLLIITGVIRLYSSSILSAFEAKVSVKTLKMTNIIIALITVVMLLLAIYFAKNIKEVLFYVVIIWISRAFIHRYMLLKQIKNHLEK